MGELLSHSEIETLLSAVESLPPRAEALPEPKLRTIDPSNWDSHDFREPEPLSHNAVELLQALHAGLCRQLARRFHSLLHSPVDFRPVGLNQMRFNECAASSTPPDLICQIGDPSQSSPWLICWQPALAHSLINRLLGGAVLSPSKSPSPAPSEIEVRLLNRLCCAVLDELARFAEPGHLNQSHEMTVVHYPLQKETELSGAVYLCASFEITCESDRGLMHCWLPKKHVVQTNQFGKDPGFKTPKHGSLAAQTPQIQTELAADLANLKLRVSEIADLAIGDVLMTDIAQHDGATLRLADRKLYQVAIGTLTGKKAVRLIKPLPSNTSPILHEVAPQ